MSIAKKDVFSKKSIKRNLALRVFLLSIVLLLFPLSIHTIWMYYHEYKANTRELLEELFEEGEARLFLIDQMENIQ